MIWMIYLSMEDLSVDDTTCETLHLAMYLSGPGRFVLIFMFEGSVYLPQERYRMKSALAVCDRHALSVPTVFPILGRIYIYIYI